MTQDFLVSHFSITLPMLLAVAETFWGFFGQTGPVLALGMAAFGSAVGIGLAGQAASGAWAKEARAGRNLSFTYIILIGMPMSQTFYAYIMMLNLAPVFDNAEVAAGHSGLMLGLGIATGLGEMLSAWMQGMIGAAGIRALSDSEGKGLAFIMIAMGIAETVGVFTMIFLLGMIPSV